MLQLFYMLLEFSHWSNCIRIRWKEMRTKRKKTNCKQLSKSSTWRAFATKSNCNSWTRASKTPRAKNQSRTPQPGDTSMSAWRIPTMLCPRSLWRTNGAPLLVQRSIEPLPLISNLIADTSMPSRTADSPSNTRQPCTQKSLRSLQRLTLSSRWRLSLHPLPPQAKMAATPNVRSWTRACATRPSRKWSLPSRASSSSCRAKKWNWPPWRLPRTMN